MAELKTESTIRTTKTVTLSGVDIIDALNSSAKFNFGKIPRQALVTVTVPGGGDYSDDVIDISSDQPVAIEWSTQDTREYA